jgi:hypothetical protein
MAEADGIGAGHVHCRSGISKERTVATRMQMTSEDLADRVFADRFLADRFSANRPLAAL